MCVKRVSRLSLKFEAQETIGKECEMEETELKEIDSSRKTGWKINTTEKSVCLKRVCRLSLKFEEDEAVSNKNQKWNYKERNRNKEVDSATKTECDMKTVEK